MPRINKFKVVLVGDQNVGKTSIISRFIHDSFEQTSNPTVGIDFVTKTMQIDGQTLRLQLWDTAGQQRFRSLIPSYVRDADCCLIVIDVSSKSTIEGLDRWHDFVRQTRGQDGLIYLVGNKVDLERQIQKSQPELFAENNGINYIQVSAKNSTNIGMLFRKVAESLIESKRINAPPEQKIDSSIKNTSEGKAITLSAQKQKSDNQKQCQC